MNIKNQNKRIAVVGIGCIFPESPESQSFWENIVKGKDLITDVPSSHWLIEDYYYSDKSNDIQDYNIAELARKSQESFDKEHKYRLSLILSDDEKFEKIVHNIANKIESSPENGFIIPNQAYYAVGNFKDEKN